MLVEILSAKNLPCIEDSMRLHSLQLHVKFQHHIIHSDALPMSIEPIFNFTCQYSLSEIESSMQTSAAAIKIYSPILIYLTKSEQVTSGAVTTTLVAIAVLDFRYSMLYSTDYISVELIPCEVEGSHMGIATGVYCNRSPPAQQVTSNYQAFYSRAYLLSTCPHLWYRCMRLMRPRLKTLSPCTRTGSHATTETSTTSRATGSAYWWRTSRICRQE